MNRPLPPDDSAPAREDHKQDARVSSAVWDCRVFLDSGLVALPARQFLTVHPAATFDDVFDFLEQLAPYAPAH